MDSFPTETKNERVDTVVVSIVVVLTLLSFYPLYIEIIYIYTQRMCIQEYDTTIVHSSRKSTSTTVIGGEVEKNVR